tara:strand:+ start:2806 stop:2955 length:150 start_codon:yes stop_codon:yes gene_type:complete
MTLTKLRRSVMRMMLPERLKAREKEVGSATVCERQMLLRQSFQKTKGSK